ncbi:unnamed protein product [Eruca vesicaria subsp. sativa]|uniref:Uncharacterized protein n=1 Tax=Eruca vesicaria subsp. sativa TaxID=29727 RepID=A0ABC8JSH5_ERUVS|nr:unnamed protein product [Eruca vesicaria subsp. sativa]
MYSNKIIVLGIISILKKSSTKVSEEVVKDTEVVEKTACVSDKAAKEIDIPENERPWSTVPQSSPPGSRNNELEVPITSSPSRFHLLSTELEEEEVDAEDESSNSEEESSVESKIALEKRKQVEK